MVASQIDKMYKVYILYSKKIERYYVGHTNNLDKRLATHNASGKKYTTKGIPWDLVKSFNCSSKSAAIELEQKIKKRGIKRYLEGL